MYADKVSSEGQAHLFQKEEKKKTTKCTRKIAASPDGNS